MRDGSERIVLHWRPIRGRTRKAWESLDGRWEVIFCPGEVELYDRGRPRVAAPQLVDTFPTLAAAKDAAQKRES